MSLGCDERGKGRRKGLRNERREVGNYTLWCLLLSRCCKIENVACIRRTTSFEERWLLLTIIILLVLQTSYHCRDYIVDS